MIYIDKVANQIYYHACVNMVTSFNFWLDPLIFISTHGFVLSVIKYFKRTRAKPIASLYMLSTIPTGCAVLSNSIQETHQEW